MEILFKNLPQNLIEQVYALHAEKLGEGYLSMDHFNNLNKLGKLLVAVKNNEVLGYLTYDIVPESQFLNKYKMFGTDNMILVLNTTAVKYEGVGIAKALSKYCIDNYSTNVKSIYVPVWKSKLGVNAHHLLKSLGINYFCEFENFWYEDSLNIKNFCPVCNTPCTCTMQIYKKDLT